MNDPILKFFSYAHLPEYLQVVSQPFHHLAQEMDINLGDCEEKRAGFRKLLEAKDCFVRAQLDSTPKPPTPK